MQLTKATLDHIHTLKTWFTTAQACALWGGPGLRFPYTDESFLEDIFWQKMPSYCYLDQQHNLIAFGQFYMFAKRCHLARLAVNPEQRGAGIGQTFIQQLITTGKQELGLHQASLFVLSDNLPAKHCYLALGFSQQDYPPQRKFHPGIEFMVQT